MKQKMGACEVLTPQKRIHSNTKPMMLWVRGNNCKGATNYYATLFENVESSFTLSLMFLGLPYTLGFDPWIFIILHTSLCATYYCIINAFQQTNNRIIHFHDFLQEHPIYYFIKIFIYYYIYAAERK
jgi:hypothetical protein